MKKLFVPSLPVAAYTALAISLVSFGIGLAALSIALILLLGAVN